MKNFYLAILTIAFSINVSAQVHINAEGNEIASAMLQVDAGDQGVSLPNVALTSTTVETPVTDPKEGLLVYNTNTTTTNSSTDVLPGYYYWSAGAWNPIGKIIESYIFQQPIDTDILGYVPTSNGSADNTAGNLTGAANTGDSESRALYVKLGCAKWPVSAGGNDHTYCAYRRDYDPIFGSNYADGADWQTTFNFAKARGGYLLTITSDAERNWLQTNVITPKNLTSGIWLGYNKYQSKYIPLSGNNNDPGFNRHRYKWITGEKWQVNWENAGGATVQNHFAAGQPSITNANGCAYITTGGTRQWDDRTCSDDQNYHHIIVEFQDTY